ncbi:hypothetical protein AAES_15415 [Amazona aestiva]|uniref:Uncharacterized protein n=1 Tax=Amazona aestiva TaxID=12930 RepID=A0A0Q3XA48_AMAAE|nr:hypothetical protein AAES_15415 [Amazona aestiva]
MERFVQSFVDADSEKTRGTNLPTKFQVNKQAEATSIEAMLLKTQLHWAGDVSRMEDDHLPKFVFYSELATGCHKGSASKRRYKDSLKEYLSLGHIDYHQLSTLASSREIWRHIMHNTA